MLLHYLGAFLLCIGFVVVLSKKNSIHILLGLELMLNAVNVNLIVFNKVDFTNQGAMFALFVIVIAVAETAIALALILKLVKNYSSSNINELNKIRD